MAQKRNNNGIDVVKISFKHKWLRKEFERRANELTYLFGRDLVFMGIRQFCFQKLDERDRLKREQEAAEAFASYNEP